MICYRSKFRLVGYIKKVLFKIEQQLKLDIISLTMTIFELLS
jgi:hypothetical protein